MKQTRSIEKEGKMNSKPFMTGVSLTDNERQIIERVSKDRGLYNFFSAIRQIVIEWDALQNAQRVSIARADQTEQSTTGDQE